MMKALIEPSIEEALRKLQDAVRRREVILVIGRCSIRYTGRAVSILKEGERILIIKNDRSVLVHRPRGLKPVNFQASSSIIKVKKNRNKLIISAYRRRPEETIEIEFNKLKLLYSEKLEDYGEFYLYGTEKEIVKALKKTCLEKS